MRRAPAAAGMTRVGAAGGEILGHHALRTRLAGRTLFVDVHIELPGDLPLARALARSRPRAPRGSRSRTTGVSARRPPGAARRVTFSGDGAIPRSPPIDRYHK
ncbi:cation transporter dimerization domain-containing protein [Sorangium sp. So ce1128]